MLNRLAVSSNGRLAHCTSRESNIKMMEYPKIHNFTLKYEDNATGGAPLVVNEIGPQNIVNRLQARELWGGRRVGTGKYLERSMYQSIFPNYTITHVDKPPCFLRKFTPDGKYFIAFSSDQMSVEVYTFQGPEAGTHLFQTTSAGSKKRRRIDPSLLPPRSSDVPWGDVISSDDADPRSQFVRKVAFETFFKLKHRITVAPQGEQLNRECSLFTEDSNYMIVGSATYIQDEQSHPSFHQMYRNNESVEPNSRFPLEEYSVHLVDIRHGYLCDSVRFGVDKIYLSHNQGIYLYNQTLAILSVQHQTIHIFHVSDGQFHPVRNIGRFCHEDDGLVLSVDPLFRADRPYEDVPINALKHRLLVYMYKKSTEKNDPADLARFHQYFEQMRKLRIWKMQLLDEDHLLLKYSSAEVVTLKTPEPNSQYCLFVIFNMSETNILAVFENTSSRLVDLFEGFSDNFRNNFMTPDARYSSSPSNNIHSKQIHQKFRQTITSARFGGPIEATKRILAQLPISAQSFSASPYLDQALYSYDDHRVSCMERPKACGEVPIRFFGRESGLFKFQIHAGILARGNSQSGRRLVAFTFHPSAPFAISVQRANAEYLVNFHLRLDTANLCVDEPSRIEKTTVSANANTPRSAASGSSTGVRPQKRPRNQET